MSRPTRIAVLGADGRMGRSLTRAVAAAGPDAKLTAACERPGHPATGKDAAVGKGTFVSVLGLHGAKARLKTLVTESEAALAPFGRDADVLKMGARFVAERKA